MNVIRSVKTLDCIRISLSACSENRSSRYQARKRSSLCGKQHSKGVFLLSKRNLIHVVMRFWISMHYVGSIVQSLRHSNLLCSGDTQRNWYFLQSILEKILKS